MPVELDDALRQVGDALRRVTVQVRSRRGDAVGSGVVWREDGLVVTNAHVATEALALVQLADGRTLTGRRVAIDPARDLAALRLDDAGGLEEARTREAGSLRPGNIVVALGNPLGWVGALGFGVVHGVDRFHGSPRWVRADVRLAPGNSGGPLADVSGAVLGINAMVAGGLGLAVPGEAVERFLARPHTRTTLGVSLRTALARGGGADRVALLVTRVRASSPAARAGLRPGDALLGVAGDRFATGIDLAVALEGSRTGDVIALDVLRDGRQSRREVRLEAEREIESEVA